MSGKEDKSSGSPWNSLELAKLVVSAMVPLSVVFFGFLTSTALQERQDALGKNSKLLEKRQEIYETLRIPLNDIYVYIADIGHYKDLTPHDVISQRRLLHTAMHTHRGYWSAETFSAYLNYMDNVAFRTFEDVNIDAKIRDAPFQKEQLQNWQSGWAELYTGEQDSNHRAAYERLLSLISVDIGATTADRK